MITRERLEKSEYGRGLLALISRSVLYMVTDWGNNDSDTKSEMEIGIDEATFEREASALEREAEMTQALTAFGLEERDG